MTNTLKHIINLVFLSISIFLSTYFLIQLTDNPYIRAGIGVFAVALEAAMQYVLALGKHHFRRRVFSKKALAFVLFACYACYILIYNIPSAVGFFVMEIGVQEQAAAKVERADMTNQRRLEQLNTTIDTLNQQLQTEVETGYGPRSRAIMEQLERLTAERDKLQAAIAVPQGEMRDVSRDVFRSLSDVTAVSANLLKIIIFGTSILMLCIILIITSWDLPGNVTVVTPTVTGNETHDVTEKMKKCACGCGRLIPATSKRAYYEPKCRTAACRSRKSEAEEG
jgi:hypothetical protein